MNWLTQLLARRLRREELSESICEHLDEKIAGLMDCGMMREQAERTARREFGNTTLIEERASGSARDLPGANGERGRRAAPTIPVATK